MYCINDYTFYSTVLSAEGLPSKDANGIILYIHIKCIVYIHICVYILVQVRVIHTAT